MNRPPWTSITLSHLTPFYMGFDPRFISEIFSPDFSHLIIHDSWSKIHESRIRFAFWDIDPFLRLEFCRDREHRKMKPAISKWPALSCTVHPEKWYGDHDSWFMIQISLCFFSILRLRSSHCSGFINHLASATRHFSALDGWRVDLTWDATRHWQVFGWWDVCIYTLTGKNLTKTLHEPEMGRNMDKEDSYYVRNQDARKDYQRQYYLNNKDRIMSKRRVEELADPEKFEQRKDYNKSYYLKNKERILKRRAEIYAAKVASRRKWNQKYFCSSYL